MDVLYVSDLDGTLFGSNGELSPFPSRKLKELLGPGLEKTQRFLNFPAQFLAKGRPSS
jgi:hypothetical protein